MKNTRVVGGVPPRREIKLRGLQVTFREQPHEVQQVAQRLVALSYMTRLR